MTLLKLQNPSPTAVPASESKPKARVHFEVEPPIKASVRLEKGTLSFSEDWVVVGDPKTQSIHPIFQQSNWNKQIDYDVLRRPLWLASRLLESPQALHYFYLNYFGINTVVHQETHRSMPQQVNCDKGILDLTDEDRLHVRRKLNALSRKIEFRIADLGESIDGKTSKWYTYRLHGIVHSIITLDARSFAALEKTDRSSEQADMEELYVALVLVHELGHAVRGGNITIRRPEDYFEDVLIAEAGFELERRIFGMIIHTHIEDWENACWASFPSREILDLYSRTGSSLNFRNLPKIPEHPVRIRISRSFVAKLFTTEFWDLDVPMLGCTELLQKEVMDHYVVTAVQGRSEQLPASLVDVVRKLCLQQPCQTEGDRKKYANPTYSSRRAATVTAARLLELAAEQEMEDPLLAGYRQWVQRQRWLVEKDEQV